jgi:hypothetical protein
VNSFLYRELSNLARETVDREKAMAKLEAYVMALREAWTRRTLSTTQLLGGMEWKA